MLVLTVLSAMPVFTLMGVFQVHDASFPEDGVIILLPMIDIIAVLLVFAVQCCQCC